MNLPRLCKMTHSFIMALTLWMLGSFGDLSDALAQPILSCEGENLNNNATVEADGTLCIGGVRLQLKAWGDEFYRIDVSQPRAVTRDQKGTRWQRRDAIEEWHKADKAAVSQGWLVHAPLNAKQKELVLELVSPNSYPRAISSQEVVWEDEGRQTQLNYSGLVAWDATGRLLEARMEPHHGVLYIKVDVRHAAWPVTVDPIATTHIYSPTLQSNQQFGRSIAAYKDMLAVGAPDIADGGRVYIFRPTAPGSAQWNMVQEIHGRLDANDQAIARFGQVMDIDENWLVVGSNATGVSIYQRQPNDEWVLFKHIPAAYSFVTNGTYSSHLGGLGIGLTLVDDYLFVRSSSEVTEVATNQTFNNAGVVAVYHKNSPGANDWGRVGVLFDDNPGHNKNFGIGMSGFNNWLVVSSERTDYVFIFKKDPIIAHQWNESEKLLLPSALMPRTDHVSTSDLFKDKLLLGLSQERNIEPNRAANQSLPIGVAYYYELNANTQKWDYKRYFQPDLIVDHRSRFGTSLKIEGETIVIGAPYSLFDQNFNVLHKNPVFVFKRDKNGQWIEDFLTTSFRLTKNLGERVFLSDGVLFASDPAYNQPSLNTPYAGVGTVHVHDFNTPPIIGDQQLRLMEGGTGSLTLDIYDMEQEVLEVNIIQGPSRGSFQLVDRVFNYTALQAGSYSETMTYKVSDGKLETVGTVSIEVVNVNDAPSAISQRLSVAEDAELRIELTGADPDEGTMLEFEIVRMPEHGVLEGQGGIHTYVPSLNFTGEDSFAFKVTDGIITSAEAEISITVTPVNDPPMFIEPLHEGITLSEDGAPIDLRFAAIDVDNSELIWTATGLPNGASFNEGRFIWTPAEIQQGLHNIEVKVSDGSAERKINKQIQVLFLDNNQNGIADIRERVLVRDLADGGDEDADNISNRDEIGDRFSPNDTDRDGILDVFDRDSDGDGLSDKAEAGDADMNTLPVDSNKDGIPDFMQLDSDEDTIQDGQDNCPRIANSDQADRDNNGKGDACDDQDSLDFKDKQSDEGGCSSLGMSASEPYRSSLIFYSLLGLAFIRRRRGSMLMSLFLVLFSIGGCVEDEKEVANIPSYKITKQNICGVCEAGTYCNLDGEIEVCVLVNGCGQIQSQTSCSNGDFCSNGVCVQPPQMTSIAQISLEQEGSIISNPSLGIHQLKHEIKNLDNFGPPVLDVQSIPSNIDVKVIPYDAFLWALDGTNFQQSSVDNAYTAALVGHANRLDVAGVSAEINNTPHFFSGELFIVTLDAMLSPREASATGPVYLEAQNYFIASIRLSGYTLWSGNNPHLHSTTSVALSFKSSSGCGCLGGETGLFCQDLWGGGLPLPSCNDPSCPAMTGVNYASNIDIINGLTTTLPVQYNDYPLPNDFMHFRDNGRPAVGGQEYGNRSESLTIPVPPELMTRLSLAPVTFAPKSRPVRCGTCAVSKCEISTDDSIGNPGLGGSPSLPNNCNTQYGPVPKICTQLSGAHGNGVSECAITTDMWNDIQNESPYKYCHSMGSVLSQSSCAQSFAVPSYCNYVSANVGSECDPTDYTVANQFWLDFLGCGQGGTPGQGVTCTNGGACLDRGNGVSVCFDCSGSGTCRQSFVEDFFDKRYMQDAETRVISDPEGYCVQEANKSKCDELVKELNRVAKKGLLLECKAASGSEDSLSCKHIGSEEQSSAWCSGINSCIDNLKKRYEDRLANFAPTQVEKDSPKKDPKENDTPGQTPSEEIPVSTGSGNGRAQEVKTALQQPSLKKAADVKKPDSGGPGKDGPKKPAEAPGNGSKIGNRATDADPVALASGELIVHHTDMAFPGPVRPLSFERYYSSGSNHRSVLGSNWSSNFDIRIIALHADNMPLWAPSYCSALAPETSCALVYTAEGMPRLFMLDAGSSERFGVTIFMPSAGSTDTLYLRARGWDLRSAEGNVLSFNEHGALINDRDRFGNGFIVEQEPTPLYALYYRYCKGLNKTIENNQNIIGPVNWSTDDISYQDTVNNYLRERINSSIVEVVCQQMGYMLDDRMKPILTDKGWPDQWLLPPEGAEGDIIPKSWEVIGVLADNDHAVRITKARIWLNKLLGSGPLPVPQTGSQRMRPKRVVDDLGRTLVFEYDDDPNSMQFGLLKQVTGPSGARTMFEYQSSEIAPIRLNEQFLVKVTRKDKGSDSYVENTALRTLSFTYAWQEPSLGGELTGAERSTLIDQFFDFYSVTQVCRVAPANSSGSACGDSNGDTGMCQNGVMLNGASSPSFCVGGTNLSDVSGGSPCIESSVDVDDYQSAIADNIVRITRNRYTDEEVIEVESKYNDDVMSDNFDRVIAQRYGGLPLSEYSGINPNDVSTITGWISSYPGYVLDYLATKPTVDGYDDITETAVVSSHVTSSTVAFLPQEVRDRYPLEVEPSYARNNGFWGQSNPSSLIDLYQEHVNPITSLGFGENCKPEDHYKYVKEIDDVSLPISSLNYVCAWQSARLAQQLLPGYTPVLAYYALYRASSGSSTPPTQKSYAVGEDSKYILRSRLTCAQLASGQTEDATHNGNLEIPDLGDPEDPEDDVWVFSSDKRQDIEDNLRRICAWTRVIDRDGRLSIYGLNYKGQEVVLVTENDTKTGYVYKETLYNADGLVREQRLPTEEVNQVNKPAGVSYTYQQPSSEWEPLWWAKRGNIARISSLPWVNQPLIASWNPTSANLLDPAQRNLTLMTQESVSIHFEYEPLFNQIRKVSSVLNTSLSSNQVISSTVYDYDYMEMSRHGSDFCQVLIVLRYWGFPFFGDVDETDPENPVISCDSGLIGEWLTKYGFYGKDINGDGIQGTKNTLDSPVLSALGLPIRVIQENPQDISSKLFTWTAYNSAGQPVRVTDSAGAEKLMRYYSAATLTESDSLAFYGYDTSLNIPAAFSYQRGFLAEVLTRRFTPNYPTDETPFVGSKGCEDLPLPYRWILPDGCGSSGVNAGLAALGIPQSLITALLSEAAADDLSTWSSLKLRYSRAGHLTEIIQDGRQTIQRHDLDGQVLAEVSPDGVITEYTYNLDGHLKRHLIQEGAAMLADTWFEHDAEGQLLTVCQEVYEGIGACNSLISPAGHIAYDTVRPLDSPNFDLLLTTHRYTAEGLPWKSMLPDGSEQKISYTGRGLPLHVRRYAGNIWRGKDYTYNVYGQPLQIKYTSSEPQALPVSYLEETFVYDQMQRLKTHVDVRGTTWQYAYNEFAQQSAVKVSLSSYGTSYVPANWEILTAYDGFGRPIASNAHGMKLSQNFWGEQTGRLYASQTTGAGKQWLTYDALGNAVWGLDAQGNQRLSLTRRDLTSYQLGLGASTTLSNSLPVSYIASTQKRIFSQDGHLLEHQVIGQGGELQTTSYNTDGLGRLLSVTNAEGLTSTYTRNLLGWPTLSEQEKEPGSTIHDIQGVLHNARGQTKVFQDFRQGPNATYEVTQLNYNGFGQVTEKFLPNDLSTPHSAYYYDGAGRLSAALIKRDELGGVDERAYVYGPQGDLELTYLNSNLNQQFKYDYLGRIGESTDHNLKLRELGADELSVKRQYTYDSLNRVLRNRLLILKENNVTSQYDVDYDYEFLSTGSSASIIYSSGRGVVEYVDMVGRLYQSEFGGRVVQYNWLGALPFERSQDLSLDPSSSPLRETRSYDGLGRLASLTYRAVDVDSQSQPINSIWGNIYCQGSWYADCAAPLAHSEYKRDVMGRVVSKHRKMGHVERNTVLSNRRSSWAGYDYNGQGHLMYEWLADEISLSAHQSIVNHQNDSIDDIYGQLKGVAAADPNPEWLYWQREQHNGSLLKITESNTNSVKWEHHNSTGHSAEREPGYRLKSVSFDGQTVAVRHDGQGNVQHDGHYDYLYDAAGRLVASLEPGSCPSADCTPQLANVVEYYLYDAGGTLVHVFDTLNSKGLNLVHDGPQIIAAYDLKTGDLEWEAVWGAGLDELIWWGPRMDEFTGFALLRDERNSPMGLWSEDASQLVAIPEYTAMGRLKLWAQDEASTLCEEEGSGAICSISLAAQNFPFGFNMAWRSSRTGLYNMRARWYSPELGQFMSHDPLGYVDSANMYAFALFDPINGWDPWGLEGEGFNPHPALAFALGYSFEVARAADRGDIPGATTPYGTTGLLDAVEKSLREKKITQAPKPGNWWDSLNPHEQWVQTKYAMENGNHFDTGRGVARTGIAAFGLLDLATGIPGVGYLASRLAGTLGRGLTKALGKLSARLGERIGAKLAQTPRVPAHCPGGVCRPHCSFPAETLVEMCDGAQKVISEVEIGDLVVSRDEHTGAQSCQPVTALHRHSDSVIYELVLERPDGQTEVLLATDDHPIWIIGAGWIDAGSLGDLAGSAALLDADGSPVRLLSHRLLTLTDDVFNLSVWRDESFFVGEGRYWVHNCETKDIALGAGDQGLAAFGRDKKADIFPFFQLKGVNWKGANSMWETITAAIHGSRNIFFNLDGITKEGFDISRANALQNVTPYPKMPASQGFWTGYELNYILSNDSISSKTSFFMNGQQVPLSKVREMFPLE